MGGENDEGFDGFAQELVGRAQNGHLNEVRDLRDDGFDFFGADAIAAGFDHVARALDDEDEAVGVHAGDVAGVELAVSEELGGFGGIVPIAEGDVVAGGDDFANFVLRKG